MATPHKRPLLVLVSGAPGSGKSTLAGALARHMRLLHIERDLFFRGIDVTKDEKVSRPGVGIPAYLELVECLQRNNVSFVSDGTLYRDVTERDFHDLVRRSCTINLHCRATNEHERFYKREVERAGGTEPDWLANHMNVLEKIYTDTVDPLDLGCPVIEVQTTDEYEPTIAELASRIMEEYERETIQTH